MVARIAIVALWLAWNVLSANAAVVPEISRPVTDLADVLRPAAEEQIARELIEHRTATGVQLAVLIVDTTSGRDIVDYAQAVFDQWRGGSKERNDGALFVLAINDRRSRLHLGYGLEAVIPDAVAKRMLDDLRPYLVDKNYERATLALVRAVRERTDHLSPGEPIAPPVGAQREVWLLVFVVGVGLGIAWAIAFKRAWRAYKQRDVPAFLLPKGARHATKTWRDRIGVASACLARQRLVQIALGVLLLGQLVLVLVFSSGHGYIAPYSLIYWHFVVVGWLIGGTPKFISVPLGIFATVALGAGVWLAGADYPAYFDPSSIYRQVGTLIGIFWLVSAMVLCGTAGAASGDGSYSSSYSSGSSSHSSSSSTSSYGSSSSSSYSSSSYSSSSYSGGGGSSGGGGASSSW